MFGRVLLSWVLSPPFRGITPAMLYLVWREGSPKWTAVEMEAPSAERAARIDWAQTLLLGDDPPLPVLVVLKPPKGFDPTPERFQLETRVSNHGSVRAQLTDILTKLDRLIAGQATQQQEEDTIMQTLADAQAASDALSAKVTGLTTVASSAEALLTGLSAQLKTALASQDTTALTTSIQNIATAIDSNVSGLSAAVAANTPAAPPAVVPAAPPAAAPAP